MERPKNFTTEHMILIGFFLLTAIVLVMIYTKNELTKDQGFMVLAQAIIISGLITVAVKPNNDIAKKQADALNKASDPAWAPGAVTAASAPPPGATTVVTTTSTTAATDELPKSVSSETVTTADPDVEEAGELPADQKL